MSKFEVWTKSKNNVNFCTGCSNDCVYCYAKGMSIRYGRSTVDNWKEINIRQHDVDKKRKKMDGLVGFPTTHDIVKENLGSALMVLRKLIDAGNKVLVISKPSVYCISRICKVFKKEKESILFRFTIGSMNTGLLKFFEPGAPVFEDRFEALKLAFNEGFETSVSMEPLLDKEAVYDMIKVFSPYVTEKIWIGKMNHQPKLLIDYETIADKRDIDVIKIKLKGNEKVLFKN